MPRAELKSQVLKSWATVKCPRAGWSQVYNLNQAFKSSTKSQGKIKHPKLISRVRPRPLSQATMMMIISKTWEIFANLTQTVYHEKGEVCLIWKRSQWHIQFFAKSTCRMVVYCSSKFLPAEDANILTLWCYQSFTLQFYQSSSISCTHLLDSLWHLPQTIFIEVYTDTQILP